MNCEEALLNLRRAVRSLDEALPATPEHRAAKEAVNRASWEVNVAIHDEFPDDHQHPGEYRPYHQTSYPDVCDHCFQPVERATLPTSPRIVWWKVVGTFGDVHCHIRQGRHVVDGDPLGRWID